MTAFVPPIQQHFLANGLKVVGLEYGRVPWVSLILMVKRGAETDPPGKAGQADWTAEYLTLGTARRSQLELARDVESLGASLESRANWDATYISLDGLAEDFATLMATLAEIVQTPVFPAGELPLLRERRRAELAQALDDPRELAARAFTRLFFQGAPYGHAIRGEADSLDALARDHLTDHYRREFTPAVATLVAVGMASFARVVEAATQHWAGWQGAAAASPPYTAAASRVAAPGVYLLDRPELTQSEIRVGCLGLPRSHPDFLAVRLMNYILGEGGFSSRLMGRIRAEMGLTYGIRSRFSFRRAPGPFTVATFTPAQHTATVVQEIARVIREVQENGVTAQELADAQSYFAGNFPLRLETTRALARQVVAVDLYDLGLEYLNRYVDAIRQVTLDQVQDAARRHLHPEALVSLVVGPAGRCREELAALGPVHPFDEI
jgi:zinc protease